MNFSEAQGFLPVVLGYDLGDSTFLLLSVIFTFSIHGSSLNIHTIFTGGHTKIKFDTN